jgi:hypothetical protein
VRPFDNTTPRAPKVGADGGAGGNPKVPHPGYGGRDAGGGAAPGADGGAGGAAPGQHKFGFPYEGGDGGAGGIGQPGAVLADDLLRRGQARDLGPIAGTGADPGIPGIGAADLGEVVTLPNGKQVMILGDSFSGNKVGEGAHYPSAAVPVHMENGKVVVDGPPLTGPDGSPNLLFPLPQAARDAGATNTLPAGTITVGKDTYMMVVGTNPEKSGLAPMGGSWLVKVTADPTSGWKPVDGSYRPWQSIPNPNPAPGAPPRISDPTKIPNQISGYQGSDGRVYIAADGFDRQQGVTMYSVDPQHITDRNAWQPWTGNGWGTPGDVATAPVSGPNSRYGELSFRDVDGSPVLSGFNGRTGSVDLHVGEAPASVFGGEPTVVAPGGDWNNQVPGTYPQNYGGYILPGSTLDDMGVLVSQWNTDTGTPYVVEQFPSLSSCGEAPAP